MNRIYKFRAWDKTEKVMLPVGDLEFKRKSAWGTDELYGAVVVLPSGHDQFYDGERLEIMQFTGLLDKNGEEIYEGDILYYKTQKHEYRYKVIYDMERGQYRVSPHLPFAACLDEGQVIGNIYENPELLNPQQNDN
jgi:uncharacterized phage protein (TIGR01671 family)